MRGNDFFRSGGATSEKQSRQSDAKYNVIQYVFQKKNIWGIFEILCIKSKLTVCEFTFNTVSLSYRKPGEQNLLLGPPIFLKEQLLPLPPPGSRAYDIQSVG